MRCAGGSGEAELHCSTSVEADFVVIELDGHLLEVVDVAVVDDGAGGLEVVGLRPIKHFIDGKPSHAIDSHILGIAKSHLC